MPSRTPDPPAGWVGPRSSCPWWSCAGWASPRRARGWSAGCAAGGGYGWCSGWPWCRWSADWPRCPRHRRLPPARLLRSLHTGVARLAARRRRLVGGQRGGEPPGAARHRRHRTALADLVAGHRGGDRRHPRDAGFVRLPRAGRAAVQLLHPTPRRALAQRGPRAGRGRGGARRRRAGGGRLAPNDDAQRLRVGLRRARRVVLYDNLVRDVPVDQVLSVVARHELSHARHDDVLTGSLLGAAGSVLGMGLLGLVIERRRKRARAPGNARNRRRSGGGATGPGPGGGGWAAGQPDTENGGQPTRSRPERTLMPCSQRTTRRRSSRSSGSWRSAHWRT